MNRQKLYIFARQESFSKKRQQFNNLSNSNSSNSIRFGVDGHPSQFSVIIPQLVLRDKINSVRMMSKNKLNPDWEKAKIHGKASKVGLNPGNARPQFCPDCYCNRVVNKTKFQLDVHAKELDHLGFGFPLLYQFFKYCGLILIISIFSYNFPSLWFAFNEECPIIEDHGRRMLAEESYERVCTSFMINMAHKDVTVEWAERILRISSFCVHLIVLIYIRNRLIKLEGYYNERKTNLSNFAIIVKNLPQEFGVQGRLNNFFTGYQIKQITLFPQFSELAEKQAKISEQVDLLRPRYKDKNNIVPWEQTIEGQKIKQIQDQINVLLNQYDEKITSDQMKTTRAIIIFNTKSQKEQILQKFQNREFTQQIEQNFGPEGRDITLKEAPQPKEIIWKNIQKGTPEYRFKKVLLGWFLSVVLLAIVTVIIYFILVEKASLVQESTKDMKIVDQTRYTGAIVLVYVVAITIVVFNKLVMASLFYSFTKLQKHTDSSKFEFSFALKYCLGLFFTTALMTLAVEDFSLHNYYSHPYGVIEEQTAMFFINSFFVPLFWLINPSYLYKLYRRRKNYGKANLTQLEANELMEAKSYMIGKRYAELIEMMWFTYLYSSLIPIGSIITLVGIILYYWVDRYNLLRRSTLKFKISGGLVFSAMKLLDMTLFFKSVGQLFFDERIRDGFRAESIAMIGISFAYVVLPFTAFIRMWYPEKFNKQNRPYDEIKDDIKDTYRSLHPIYSRISKEEIKEHFEKYELRRALSCERMI